MAQSFPFVFELPMARWSLWVQYAWQVSTFEQMRLVSNAFSALWWDVTCVSDYEHALACVASGDWSYVVSWLDQLFSCVASAREFWASSVVVGLESLLGEGASSDEGYQDAAGHVQSLTEVQGQIVQAVSQYCLLAACPLPKQVQAFLDRSVVPIES